MREEIKQLIAGESIQKEIKTELAYKDLDIPEYGDTDTSRNNLWSILYTTGYLTTKSCDGKIYELIIPNREIHDIFVTQIKEWMQDTIIQGNLQKLKEFLQEDGMNQIYQYGVACYKKDCKIKLGKEYTDRKDESI